MRRAALVVLVALSACARGPKAIDYGRESCEYCRMVITDPRYGAELVTTTGKVRQFDSIECLASYFVQARASGTVRSAWVSDFAHPGTLIPAATAVYVRAPGPSSPMGKGLTAFAPGTDSLVIQRIAAGGLRLSWDDVVATASNQADTTLLGSSAERHALVPAVTPRAQTIDVAPDGAVRTIARALELARPGARIVVHPGVYREPTIVVRTPVEIVGEGDPVLDGEGKRQIMTVLAPDVTVRGLHFRNVGASYVEDRAAIKVVETTGCAIEDNRIDDGFFGIYLARVSRCRVVGNTLHATAGSEAASGNGIHLWTADSVTIAGNTIVGHRDGIYFEFVHDSEVRDNVSEANLRYGLHFMYSDGCRYERNTFRRNGAGVAVMYTKHVEMAGNRFERNWGSAAYGLLLKEISDVRVERNSFVHNTTGLFADGTTRLTAEGNEFVDNGWALRVDANAQDGRVTGNDFVGNTFDVATNGGEGSTVFDGNYFDTYEGYDLDRDGVGDVPHRPVRLFSVIVERDEPALILLRSFFAGLLDASERFLPALTPETLVDAHPAMRRRVAP